VTAPVSAEPEPTAAPPWRRLTTIPALDGVRGLAVLLVVVTHLQLLVPYEVTGISWVDDIIEGSYLGVDLFFVLSGFLITSLLLNEVNRTRTLRFGAFYARRALRLLPALYVLLAAHAVYAWWADLSWLQEWATIRSAVLYVSNWQLVFRPLTGVPDLGLLWSLAIEEQFYLLWPAVLITFLGPREPAARVGAILVAAIAAVAVWRAHLWQTGVFWAQLAVRTDTRIDALLVGALLASLWVRRTMPRTGANEAAWIGLAVIVGCLATFDITEGTGYKGGLTLFAVAAAAVIWGLLEGRWGGRRVFDLAPLRALGRVSYGVYLWHYPIFYAVSVQGEQWTNLERVLVAPALTVVAVLASWYLVERPALRLKRRFRVAPSGPTPLDRRADAAVAAPPGRRRPELSPAAKVGVALAAVLALAVLVRFTALVGDPDEVDGLPQPAGIEFPVGDADRSGYWSLVDLQATFEEDFDRDDADDLGDPWDEVAGDWRVTGDTAVLGGDPGARTDLAVAPQVANDGLAEVTLSLAPPGAGLAFRYEGPDDWWAVTTAADGLGWQVIQTIQGQRSIAAEFSGPVYDGVTVTITQADATIRFLLDGVEYFRLLAPAPEDVLRAGLAADGPASVGARWDRFLLMASSADVDAAG